MVFTIQHTPENGSGNLMVVMLIIQTGILMSLIIMAEMRIALKYGQTKALLAFGMTNPAGILLNISVRKIKVGKDRAKL